MNVPEDVLEGVRLFNEGDYFEAHERWEDHWGHGPADERTATLGLIKCAVALHHLRGGNMPGFVWQAEQGVPHLRDNAHVWPELRLDELAEALDSLLAQCRFHGRPAPDTPWPVIPPLNHPVAGSHNKDYIGSTGPSRE